MKVYGLSDVKDITKRTPTFGLTIDGKTSHQVAEYLAKHGIFFGVVIFSALDVVREYDLEKRWFTENLNASLQYKESS